MKHHILSTLNYTKFCFKNQGGVLVPEVGIVMTLGEIEDLSCAVERLMGYRDLTEAMVLFEIEQRQKT